MTDVTIIIPIGPGHEEIVQGAYESILRASEKPGPFTDIKIGVIDDTKGEMGRSKARNTAVGRSTGEWLFFLDADDLLLDDAFVNVEPYLEHDAIWGLICELRPDGHLLYRTQQLELDNYNQDDKGYLRHDPFTTCQMGHFVKRDKFLGFDESMDVGEDCRYYLDMWKTYDNRETGCIKVRKPFFVNRRGFHSKGPKAGTGRDWNRAVRKLFDEARAAS